MRKLLIIKDFDEYNSYVGTLSCSTDKKYSWVSICRRSERRSYETSSYIWTFE